MNIFIGNLSFTTTEEELHAEVAAFGEVTSVNIIMDRDTGRSRGFGFVEMANSDEAQAAIASLNGKQVGGRALTVNEAKPREPRSNNRGGGGDRW